MNEGVEVAAPWSELPQRWGHPWHRMCSYLGTFPGALARTFIGSLSDEGDIVLDPFSGRGTTLLEARLTGRIPLASDLNPIAIALSQAKNVSVSLDHVIERIETLHRSYDGLLYEPMAEVESDDICLIYHPGTLAQLCYLRKRLLGSTSPVDQFLVGCVLGVMHGSERQDGSSAYASISMPNTYSMPPNYVRRFVETNQLQRVRRDVFELLRSKARRLLKDSIEFPTAGTVVRADAKSLSNAPEYRPYIGKVKLILGSPPYLDVVNYAKQNWIRAWFLGEHHDVVSGSLDDNLTLAAWLEFAQSFVAEARRMMSPDGAVVLVMGDVARRTSRSVISLAREFIRRELHRGHFGYIGCLSDRLQTEVKTTRIWKDTRGQATAVDRVIVLANEPPRFRDGDLLADLYAASRSKSHMLDAQQMRDYALAFAGG